MFTKTKKITAILALAVVLVINFALFISGNSITAYSAQSEYTVTFYPQNGKSARNKTVAKGEKVTPIIPPSERDGTYFSCWTDKDGNVFDFDQGIESDLSLYARYTLNDAYILADMKGETVYDYSQEQTKLTALNGMDNRTTVNDPNEVTELEFDDSGNSVYYVHSYGFVKYPSIRFNAGISIDKIDVITLRLYVHLSPSSANGIDNTVGGFALAGIESTGKLGECITVDSKIKQDKWVDLTLNRNQAKTLADQNGIISGIAFISNFKNDPANPPMDGTTVYSGGLEYKEGGFVKLDYVTFNAKTEDKVLVTINPNNGENPTYIFVDKNSVLDLSDTPVKAGYDFSGWLLSNGLPFETDTIVTEDVELIAEYVKDDQIVTVTVDDNRGNVTVYELIKGSSFSEPSHPTRSGHEFVCWADENGKEYDFSSKVNADLRLYATYRKLSSKVLVDFSADYYCTDTKLQSLNGYDDMTAPRSDKYVSQVKLIKDVWSYSVKYEVGSWGFTKYPTINFAPIEVNKIKSLTFRLLVHINDGLIDDRYGGFAFSSVDSYGETGSCLQLPSDIEQDNWIDFTITPEKAQLLSDNNGVISGISAISNFKYDVNVNPTADGSGVFNGAPDINATAFVRIDSISYELRDANTVALYVNPGNGEQTSMQFVNIGQSITRPQTPAKDGYEFLEWVDKDGNAFNFTNGITEDTSVYARYKTSDGILLTDFTGDYTVSDGYITSLNGQNNQTVGNDKYFSPLTIQKSASGMYAKYPVHCWGFTNYPTINFPKIDIQSYKSLKVRIYIHLNDGLIDNTFGGFAFAGATSTGAVGECFVIPSAVVQDEWIDFEFSAFDLQKLADKNGYISGLSVVANFRQDNALRDENGEVLTNPDGSLKRNFQNPGVYPYGHTEPDCGYVLVDSLVAVKRNQGEVAVLISESNGSATKLTYLTEGQTLSLDTPVKTGHEFVKWVDEFGNTLDSTTPITEDMRVFAVYRQTESGLDILVDFSDDFTTGEHNLKYINGFSRSEYNTSFAVPELDKGVTTVTDNGLSYGVFNTNNYGSVTYPAIKFLSPVSVKDIDYLKIRLYVHLFNGAYDTSTGGFVLCGINGSGLKSECYMIPEAVKQDEWIDLVMTRSEASLFANAQGVIEGISIGSMFRYDPKGGSSKGVYVGDDGYDGYVNIDYIGYMSTKTLADTLKYKVTFNGYQTEKIDYVTKYGKVVPPVENPVKDGYKFSYWALNGKKFDFEKTVVISDLVLDPVFVYDYLTDLSFVGAYTNGSRTIVLNADDTVKIYSNATLIQKEKCAVLTNGAVMVNDVLFATYDKQNKTLTSNGTVYSKGGGFVITFESNGGQPLEKLAFGGNVVPELPVPTSDSGLFIGWYKDESLTQAVEKGDTVAEDLILYAKYDTDVVTATLNYVDGNVEKTSIIIVKKGEKLVVDFLPEKTNCVFSHWATSNGTHFDTESALQSSVVLYAEYQEISNYLITANAPLSKNNGVLQFVNGNRYYNPKTGADETNLAEITRVQMDETLTGYAYKMTFHSWCVTLSSNAIVFDKAVNVANIDGLTIRMYAYLSSANTYDVQSGGIKLFGLTNTGDIGEGVMIPDNVKQNEWFDLYISKSDCVKMADENGVLGGLQIGSRILNADLITAYEGLGTMYILIDYVSLTEKVKTTFVTEQKTYEFYFNKGDKLESKYIVPEKDGYMFAGWLDQNGNVLPKNTVVMTPLTLTARWIEKQSFDDYKGYYLDENGNAIILDDTIEIGDDLSYDDICFNGGKIYLFSNGDITVYNLASYQKLQTVKVTYDYLYGKQTVIYPKNAMIIPLDLSGRVNGFKGYVDIDGNPVNFANGFASDITVYADIDWVVETDCTPYVGWYKLGEQIIKLTNTKITAFGTTTDYSVSNGILCFTLNGVTKYATITAYGIDLDDEIYLKLNAKIVVTFSTGGISREPERIEVTLSDGYVMKTKLREVSAVGYNFLGWYDADGNKVEENSVFYESAVLYARWEKLSTETGENDKGCSSSVNSTLIAVYGALAVATVIIIKRRKQA